MLTLTQNAQDRIRLTNTRTGEVIDIQTVRIGHGEVRLGLTASLDWEIMRLELIDDEEREAKAARDARREERRHTFRLG